jgi:hypothetical protein
VAARASYDFLSQRINDFRDEMRAGFVDVRTEMRAELVDVRTEMRAGFTDVRAEVRGLRWRVDALLLATLGVIATLAVKL